MNTRFVRSQVSIACLLLLVPVALGDTKPTKATVRAADGLSIAYDVRGKGDTALVFLHGWCGDREFWKHQLDAFAGDYRVVALDQAGHGHSMGGPVGLAAAKRLPGTVVAVIGVDTLHNVEYKWPEEQTKQILAAFEA